MSLPAANVGAILRRQFDQGIASQQANVYVDGALVGTWYHAGVEQFTGNPAIRVRWQRSSGSSLFR